MPRIRTIKPETFDDPDLCALHPLARWLFVGLWTQADKAGRLEDEPRRLKARVLPYDDCNIEELLDLLTPRFIQRYAANGNNYIQINNFQKHQHPHPKEAESTIPEPAVKLHGKPRKNGASKVDSGSLVLDSGSLILDAGSLVLDRSCADGPRMVDGFDVFWDAYPRKTGKAEARKAWTKLKPSAELKQTILDSITAHNRSEQWAVKRIIPHASTWLHQRRFEDSPDPFDGSTETTRHNLSIAHLFREGA